MVECGVVVALRSGSRVGRRRLRGGGGALLWWRGLVVEGSM